MKFLQRQRTNDEPRTLQICVQRAALCGPETYERNGLIFKVIYPDIRRLEKWEGVLMRKNIISLSQSVSFTHVLNFFLALNIPFV